ncbi:MAG: hypothetical protein V5786_10540 [Psychromonas sp.]
MKRWQQLMTQGNQRYADKKWHEALSYYYQAITSLEKVVAIESSETQQALQAWICGYHNVATTYEQQGLIERSRDTLVIPFRSMLTLSYNPQASSEMKLIANQALKITLPPLLAFANKHPNEFQFINNIIEQLNVYNRSGHTQH